MHGTRFVVVVLKMFAQRNVTRAQGVAAPPRGVGARDVPMSYDHGAERCAPNTSPFLIAWMAISNGSVLGNAYFPRGRTWEGVGGDGNSGDQPEGFFARGKRTDVRHE